MAKIELTHKKYSVVDEDDVERLRGIRWHFVGGKHRGGKGYGYTNINHSAVSMHQFLLGCPFPKGGTIDHKNGDGLDNRKENLRFASYSHQRQNSGIRRNNTTGFKGVIKRKYRYSAVISGKHLGYFKDKVEAAKAYNEAAIQLFGQFARLNEV